MMDISTQMTSSEVEQLRAEVLAYNRSLSVYGTSSNELGKDDFLKILIAQLTNQDPTEPMEDREFIAQMAQFSTLEQMTNLSAQFERLGGLLQSGQAVSLLGKIVDIFVGDSIVTGEVDEVTGGEFPQVLVNNVYYDYADVQRVRTAVNQE
jgi:flagellar basal-body rod modification protein FlgD